MYEILENYAKYSYERLSLLQPHFKTNGLFKVNSEFIILCEVLDTKIIGDDRRSVKDEFYEAIVVAGCPLKLANQVPLNATLLPERSIEEISALVGNPLTIRELNQQLSLSIDKSFPSFWISDNMQNYGWEVYSNRNFTQEEKSVITNKIHSYTNTSSQINFHIKDDVQEHFLRKTSDPLLVSTSNHSLNDFSDQLMNKWRKDEEIWFDNQRNLFTYPEESYIDKPSNSACIINGQLGEAHNIRNYLTMFEEVKLIMPIESSYEGFLHSLDLKEEELFKLIELNKITLIFPHSVERYNKRLLEETVYRNSDRIVLSRELAYKTIEDLKYRNPLPFLKSSTREKQEILADLYKLSTKSESHFDSKWIAGLAKDLSHTWDSMYHLAAIRGAMGTYNIGLGPLITSTLENLTGKNYFLEVLHASNSIEWAAANNAVLVPIGPLAKNEEKLAYLYSGVREDWKIELETNPNVATGEILTIAQYVPVIELANAFSGSEVQRFREMITNVSNNRTSEEISAVIKDFNDSVKRFEKRRNRTESWDIKGITLDAGLELANSAIPFAGFITKQIGKVMEKTGERHTSVGVTLDSIQSKINRTSPNVILVSKMRDKVKNLL